MSEVPRPGAPEQQPFSANSLLSDIGDAVLKAELGQVDAAEALADLKLLAGTYFSEKKAGKTFDKDVEVAIQTELRKLKAEADKLATTTSTSASAPTTPAPAAATPPGPTPPARPPVAPAPRASAPLPTPTPPPTPRATATPTPAAGGPPTTPTTPEAPDPEYLAILARLQSFQRTIHTVVDAVEIAKAIPDPPSSADSTTKDAAKAAKEAAITAATAAASSARQELLRFRREIPGLSARGRRAEATDLKNQLDELDAAYKADLEAITAAKPKEEQADIERELNALPLFEVLFSRMFTDGDITTTKELIYEKVIKQKVEQIIKDTTNNVPGERDWSDPERKEFEKLIMLSVVPLMEFGVFKNKTINTWDVTVHDPDVLLDAIGVAAGSTEANAMFNSNRLVGSTFKHGQIDRHQYRERQAPPPPLRSGATPEEVLEHRNNSDDGMGPIQEICCVMYSLMSTIGSDGGFDVSVGRYTADRSQQLVDHICNGSDYQVELADGSIRTINPGRSLRHLPEDAKKIVKRLALFKASRDDLAQKASNKIMAFDGKSPKIVGGSNAKDYVSGYIARSLYKVAYTAENGPHMFFFSYADPFRIHPLKTRRLREIAYEDPETPLDSGEIGTAKFSFNKPLTVLNQRYLQDMETIIRRGNEAGATDRQIDEANLAKSRLERARRSLTLRQKMNLLDASHEFQRPGFDRAAVNVELQNWDDDFPSIDDFTNRTVEGKVARSAAEYKKARDAFKKIIETAYISNAYVVSQDTTSARKSINNMLSELLTQYALVVAYMGTGVVNRAGASADKRFMERYNSYHSLARGAIKVAIMNILMAVPGELKKGVHNYMANAEVRRRRQIVRKIVQEQIDNYPSIASGINVDLSSLHNELTGFLENTNSWLIESTPVNAEGSVMDYNRTRIANTPELQQLPDGRLRDVELTKRWSPPFA